MDESSIWFITAKYAGIETWLATSDESTLENRNRSRSLAVILVLAVSFLGLVSESAVVAVAAGTYRHANSWTGSWTGSNTWTRNSWSYTNSWRWTQSQDSHSWSHNQHSYQQATTVTVVSPPYWNGGQQNGGQYNGGQYNGGYYNGGYYNGGYPAPSPNQCYPYPYNGCYPSDPSQSYCPTTSYCPAEVTQSTTTVQPLTETATATITQVVTAAPNSTVTAIQPVNNGQSNYMQTSGNGQVGFYGWLIAIAVFAGLAIFALGYLAPKLRTPISPTEPSYLPYAQPQPSVSSQSGSLFCGRCGTPAPQGHVYCSKCGLRLG